MKKRPVSGLTIPEAATMLGTYRNMLYRLRRKGQLKTITRAGRILVPVAEVRRLADLWRRVPPTTRSA